MQILNLLFCLGSVSSVLVNTFHPWTLQEAKKISSLDAATLMKSSFVGTGSDILNQIPPLSWSNFKKRGWIIVAGLDDSDGAFKTDNEDILFQVYGETKDFIEEISLSAPHTFDKKTLSSELSALRQLGPYSVNNYVLVITGLQEIPKDSNDFKIGLQELEQELKRFKEASKEIPLLITTVSRWESTKLVARQVISNSCAQSETECLGLYKNCSNHGKCLSKKLGKNKDCWICSCISIGLTDETGKVIPGFETPRKWAGEQCELEDISVPFQILFWTSVALLLLLMMVIGMMLKTGDSGDSFTGNQYEHRLKEE